jgi:hypothetical protein
VRSDVGLCSVEMGIIRKLFGGPAGGPAMDDQAEGSARVIARSDHSGRGIKEICTLHLVVQADGIEPTAIEISPLVHRDRWPDPDMELPVTVDRANPARVEITWEQVPSVTERRRQSAEAAAEAIRRTDQG